MERLATQPTPEKTSLVNHSVSDQMCYWYALWTRSRHEVVVREQLHSKGIETFLPTIGRWSRWKDRRKRIEWPLFPGYCFAKFKSEQSLAVLTCMGVAAIVSFSGRPAPIAEEEVNALRSVIDSQTACDPCPFVNEGSLIKVIKGPLAGVVGRLVQKNAQRAELIVGVELINQGVRIKVHAADVRPV